MSNHKSLFFLFKSISLIFFETPLGKIAKRQAQKAIKKRTEKKEKGKKRQGKKKRKEKCTNKS